MKKFLIAIVSLLLAVIYTFPNLALFFGVVLVVYHKWISGAFIFIFAFNIAKLVQSRYERYLSKRNEEHDTTECKSGSGEGYSYKNTNGRISFTFEIDDTDGRQLSRLKFFRKQFFKD